MAQQMAQQQQNYGQGGGQPVVQNQGGGQPVVQNQGGVQPQSGGSTGQGGTGQPQVNPNLQQGGVGGQQVGFGGGNPTSLAELAAHPTFNVIKQVVQQRPEALTQILQEIQRTNPDLFVLISNNRDEFIRRLKDPVQTDLASQIAQQYTDSLDDNQGDPETHVEVSEEEVAAVNRICENYGFPKAAALEAFLISGKNEEIAVN